MNLTNWLYKHCLHETIIGLISTILFAYLTITFSQSFFIGFVIGTLLIVDGSIRMISIVKYLKMNGTRVMNID